MNMDKGPFNLCILFKSEILVYKYYHWSTAWFST